MSFALKKYDGESWLDAALRLAEPYGLSWEIKNSYKENMTLRKMSEKEAAFEAAYEWDILDYESKEL